MNISKSQMDAIELVAGITGESLEVIVDRVNRYAESSANLAILIEIDNALGVDSLTCDSI